MKSDRPKSTNGALVHMAHLAVAFPCRWCAGGMALAWRSSGPAAEKACAKGIPIRKSGRDAARMSRNRKGLRAVLREMGV